MTNFPPSPCTPSGYRLRLRLRLRYRCCTNFRYDVTKVSYMNKKANK